MSDSILQVNQIKDKGGNATGITVADSSANVTINNLAAGTIGTGVNLPAGTVVQVAQGFFNDDGNIQSSIVLGRYSSTHRKSVFIFHSVHIII